MCALMHLCCSVMLLIQQCFITSEVLGFLGVIPWGQEAETDKKYEPMCITEVLKVTKVAPWAIAICDKLMGEYNISSFLI